MRIQTKNFRNGELALYVDEDEVVGVVKIETYYDNGDIYCVSFPDLCISFDAIPEQLLPMTEMRSILFE